MTTKDLILKQLAENAVIIYMKGIPSAPECGFSAKAVEILTATKIPFAYVNVLQAPFIREKLPAISKWPTFPQLFVNGDLIGGADIIEAMHKDGTLLGILAAAANNRDDQPINDQAISRTEVEKLISDEFPQAKIMIEGQGCDLAITVISAEFAGLGMMKQHQCVMTTLSEPLASGRLHAVTLKTYTPEQWHAQQPEQPGLIQIQL